MYTLICIITCIHYYFGTLVGVDALTQPAEARRGNLPKGIEADLGTPYPCMGRVVVGLFQTGGCSPLVPTLQRLALKKDVQVDSAVHLRVVRGEFRLVGGFRVRGSGFRVKGPRLRVEVSRFRV